MTLWLLVPICAIGYVAAVVLIGKFLKEGSR
jgi:hypothetical protein